MAVSRGDSLVRMGSAGGFVRAGVCVFFRSVWLKRLRLAAVVMAGCLILATGESARSFDNTQTATAKKKHHTAVKPKTVSSKTSASKKTVKARTRRRRGSRAARAREAAKLRVAFVASTELRPMAQQLAATRTAAAYAGVTAFAHSHTGEKAAAAYLALGHAYLADNHYDEAAQNFRMAKAAGDSLADYDDYLGAKALHGAGNDAAAEALLKGFADHYPDSIFVDDTPELEAQVLLGIKDPTGARKALLAAPESSDRPGYQLVLAEIDQTQGQTDEAVKVYKNVLLSWPISYEGQTARTKLTQLGMESTLTATELRSLGDAYYKAGKYDEASDQYHALARSFGISAEQRNEFAVAAAACDLKLKKLTHEEAEALPQTNDENGARRLYLLMELARNRDDETAQQSYVDMLTTSFPHSQWLAEALFSSGNMYLLKKDYPQAVKYYSDLAEQFPDNSNAAAAHWRAGWWSYRQGLYPQAEKIFTDQIRLYPSAKETVSALYWRARMYEEQDHQPGLAAAHYRTIVKAYSHYFYANMASMRLTALGDPTPVSIPALDKFAAQPVPRLDATFPADDPHLVKAHLLVNAGLTEYVPEEIAAAPGSESWSKIAEAQLYASYGDAFHAMRVLKRALPYASSAPIQSIPLAYWRILFPQPYWDTIQAESAKNGLDPYFVASLIRQESEFNPSAISHANAYGLMQLLPSVGKQMAREEGLGSIDTRQLLDPVLNIRLGTRYLRETMEHFGRVPEYALAAYNAGENRVTDWQAAGPYTGIDEFVESIPFSETREYVEAIVRNQEMYRDIDRFAKVANTTQRAEATTASAGIRGADGRDSQRP